MPYNTKTVKRDGSGITPVPQHFNPIADDYEPIYGRNNAGRVELYGPDGNPISADDSNKLAVRATEIESLLNDIKGKDFATQTTLAQILAKIIAAPATEAKQTAIELILNSLDGKDYSTLAKQNEILAKLAALETKLSGTLDTQLSGSNVMVGKLQNVTTAGTRVQLPDQVCREVTLIGLRTNTGYIYVGGNDVSSVVYGVELAAKDSITLQVSNTNMIYIDASVNGEGISYVTI